LEDSQRTDPEVSAKDGEESVEEDRRPADFRDYMDNQRGSSDKKLDCVRSSMMTWKIISRLATTAQKTPAGWLGTVLPLSRSVNHWFWGDKLAHALDIITVQHSVGGVGNAVCLEAVHGLDVRDHDQNGTREHKKESDDAQEAGGVEAKEDNCMALELDRRQPESQR
jgi:hypothetical protein